MLSFLQTEWWAKFKEGQGWQVERHGPLLGLSKQLPLGRSFLYFPEIPLALEEKVPFDPTSKFISHYTHFPRPKGRIFTRFEFWELWESDKARDLLSAGLVKAFEEVQPEYRQWLDLNQTEAELLKQMKPKGRYNINLAKRHRLTVKWGITPESVASLTTLYQETAVRAGFQGRNYKYFEELAQILAQNQTGDIVVVSQNGTALSALMIIFYDGVASYLYGGSGGDRSLMAPYLAHWSVIKRAQREGCRLYDLLAIAPPDNESHPHSGLTRFKTQFGGRSVRLLGSWDLVERPFWYTMYRFAERRRRKVTS